MQGDPTWLTPSAGGGGPTAGGIPTDANDNASWEAPQVRSAPSNSNVGGTGSSSGGGGGKNGIQILLSILVIICCGLLMTVAVFGLIDFNYANILNYSDLFVSIYMVLFGGLLLTYELMWWRVIPIPPLNKSMRKNFGFLYGIKGKALFIVFVAFLNFGLTQEIRIPYLAMGTGIFFFVVAFLHLVLAFWKPELFGTYQAPTQGLTDSPV